MNEKICNEDTDTVEKARNPHFLRLQSEDLEQKAAPVYFLWDRVKISRQGKGFTCPVKSLALFAHNQDFYYRESEAVMLLDNCREREDVL